MYTNSGINKVLLVGQITREPRWHTDGLERWLCFTLLTREIIISAKGDYEHEETHQIRMSEGSPALKKLTLKKSDVIFVQGKIHTKSFVDTENIRRYKSEIIVHQVERFAPADTPAYVEAVQ